MQLTQIDRRTQQTQKPAEKGGNVSKYNYSSILLRLSLHSHLCCNAGLFHRDSSPPIKGKWSLYCRQPAEGDENISKALKWSISILA